MSPLFSNSPPSTAASTFSHRHASSTGTVERGQRETSSVSLLTETVPGSTADHFPKAQYLSRLAAHHREEGRDEEALACLQQASDLLIDRTQVIHIYNVGQEKLHPLLTYPCIRICRSPHLS